MQTNEALIVPTGISNTASIRAALRRLEVPHRLAEHDSEIVEADCIVLPGVGAFGAGMSALRSAGLVEPLAERLRQRRPTLAICLGMQLLATASEESPGIAGLGIIDAEVRRLPRELRVPQMGWNQVEGEVFDIEYAYFANSFALESLPPDWRGASFTYGRRFVAGMRSGDVMACQFHPELSGPSGMRLLQTWLSAILTGGVRC